jgi:enoyl-[acyl-carrier protein] reductase / trans-2-enoyl-CoA reductase (NAD+)
VPFQKVTQRSHGFVCINAHPEGCRLNVERQIQAIVNHPPMGVTRPRNVLVIGASTGYGLASRIAAAWGFDARTLGVSLERPPESEKTGTAGFYNTVTFHKQAQRDGLFAASINGDAFSDEVKLRTLEVLRKQMGPLDLVIYSVAAPRRRHPRTRRRHDSVLKPIGEPYTDNTIELASAKVVPVTIAPANKDEIADTVAVMGGEDWRMWIELLLEENLLANGVRTLAFTYIGNEFTWPIYRDGTIGQAKRDLEETARKLNNILRRKVGGNAMVSVNQAVVTQASTLIPVVPLYISVLSKVMKSKGLEESPIEHMRRLFFEFLPADKQLQLDPEGRIRLDERELRPDVQACVAGIWSQVTTENLSTATDFSGFTQQFHNLFGFQVDGIDYRQPVETDLKW